MSVLIESVKVFKIGDKANTETSTNKELLTSSNPRTGKQNLQVLLELLDSKRGEEYLIQFPNTDKWVEKNKAQSSFLF